MPLTGRDTLRDASGTINRADSASLPHPKRSCPFGTREEEDAVLSGAHAPGATVVASAPCWCSVAIDPCSYHLSETMKHTYVCAELGNLTMAALGAPRPHSQRLSSSFLGKPLTKPVPVGGGAELILHGADGRGGRTTQYRKFTKVSALSLGTSIVLKLLQAL